MANFRITFRSEVYIKAENVDEARSKWERMELWAKDARDNGAEFIEIVSVENDNNDLTNEF